jgi:hypothetical protein
LNRKPAKQGQGERWNRTMKPSHGVALPCLRRGGPESCEPAQGCELCGGSTSPVEPRSAKPS